MNKHPDLTNSLDRIFVNVLQVIKIHSCVYIYIANRMLTSREYITMSTKPLFCIIGPRVFKK